MFNSNSKSSIIAASIHDDMSEHQEKPDAANRLRRGYRPVWVGLRGRGRAQYPLQEGFQPRRPPPLEDDDDDVVPPAQEVNANSAVHELEDGLAAAAHGPPHMGVVDGGNVQDDGGHEGDDDKDDDGDGLHTAHSTSSLNTEEALAFVKDWEDGADGQDDKAHKRAPSADPSTFQDARDTARGQLAMAAFFASMGKGMMAEHKRAQTEADHYMSEVGEAM